MTVISSKPVSMAEAAELLTARGKESELGYEQKEALAHAERFSKSSAKEAATLIKDLMKNKKLTLESAIKLVDIRPKKPDTVRAIILREKIDLSDDDIAEVLKLLD